MLYQYEFLFPLMITIGVVTMVAYLMWVAKKYQLPDKTIDRLIIILSISGAGMLFLPLSSTGCSIISKTRAKDVGCRVLPTQAALSAE